MLDERKEQAVAAINRKIDVHQSAIKGLKRARRAIEANPEMLDVLSVSVAIDDLKTKEAE